MHEAMFEWRQPGARRDWLRLAAAWAACGAGAPAWAQTPDLVTPAERPGLDPATSLGHDREGQPLTLADLHPRALVVCFWASWCPHCRTELPFLEKLQQSVSPHELRVVLVNTEPVSDWRRVRQHLEGRVQALMTHDGDGQSRKAFSAPDSVPYTVILGRDGRTLGTLRGWSEKRLAWLVDKANIALQTRPRPG